VSTAADQLKQIVLEELTRIAPEIEPASIAPDASFREELDLDSMDFLNFVLALHTRLGVEIPEIDYPQLYTLAGAVAYLAAKTRAPFRPDCAT
jgi:acyl carrier protein